VITPVPGLAISWQNNYSMPWKCAR